MTTRDGRSRSPSRRSRVAALALLALAAQAGCGREFFREWANQDVSEAVFEKSRDPRWRLDLFSVEPPALARFADPYDPDRPPAPPDDHATEATSPVPQWPDNRLIMPAEGTAYLEMLDAWTRNRPVRRGARAATPNGPLGAIGAGALTPPAPPPTEESDNTSEPEKTPAPPTPPADAAASPFRQPEPGANDVAPVPRGIPGTGRPPLSPIPVPDAGIPSAPADTAPKPSSESPQAQTPARPRDAGVMLSAFQDTGLPLPADTPGASPSTARPQPPAAPATGPATPSAPGGPDAPLQPPRTTMPPPIGLDPFPTNRDLSQPVNPRPDLSPDQYRASETLSSELASILVPKAITFSEAEAAGLPMNSQPYVIDMRQAFTLALINSRAYQFNVEAVYINALAVTLQRFVFTPQFYAGLGPSTGVATGGGPSPGGGIPAPNPINQFNYQTAETGSPLSALTLGQVAGFGKVFQSGARLLAGFASQIVFNFAGPNGRQPTVRGFLPLTLAQPFLRGGGRAVTLEPLTQAERNLLYSIRNFAKFRQEFTVATLVGGNTVTNLGSPTTNVGFTAGGNTDPAVGFLNLLEDIQIVENQRRNIAAYEQFKTVYAELIKGESSGLTQLQLDQVDQQLQNARQSILQTRNQYRNDLDNFKVQMGLPPDTPLIPDRGIVQIFRDVYDAVDEWQRDPKRDMTELPKFADRLPKLPDVVIDGRSVLGVYKEGKGTEDELEDLLLAAERVALEHRLDMMNNRATLYDAWRSIKVNANALQGVFNVSLTNQFLTPPTTSNPFSFLDQAKAFSLVINAELPLVRLSERNNFRTALINYQRARRNLQSQEDTVKVVIRSDIRAMQATYLSYEIAKRNFVLLIRQKDQAFEQIIAPPQGAAGAGNANGAVQTNNLIQAQNQLVGVETTLIQQWYQFQTQRLALYRDLGTLPIDEWEAFHELFPDEPVGADADATPVDPRAAGAPAPDAPTP